jgi:hypothetical protein
MTFLCSGAACAGAILLASGIAAANPAAALAVSVLFIAALALKAAKDIFQALYNKFVLHKELTTKGKVVFIITCSLSLAVSALGIFALLAKFLAIAAFTVSMGWAAAGGLGVLLVVVVCLHLASRKGSVAKELSKDPNDEKGNDVYIGGCQGLGNNLDRVQNTKGQLPSVGGCPYVIENRRTEVPMPDRIPQRLLLFIKYI